MRYPEIVAELSANHFQDWDRIRRLIDTAKTAGADAVKLQVWQEDTMTLGDYLIKGTTWSGQRMRDLYRQAHMPWGLVEKAFIHAENMGIDCLASVFDKPSLAFLEDLGCPRYKIASFEVVDIPLIRATAATGKPIVLSTGASTEGEIWEAMTAARHARSLTLLKCTSAYPAEPSDANLKAMQSLRNMGAMTGLLDLRVGLSDHTRGIAVPVAAAVLGAQMIEKHLTLAYGDGGPDEAFSIDPVDFGVMVRSVEDAVASMGNNTIEPCEREAPSLQFRRSLYWARHVDAGQTITPEDLCTARPAAGDPPLNLWKFIGMTACRTFERGDPAHLSDTQ